MAEAAVSVALYCGGRRPLVGGGHEARASVDHQGDEDEALDEGAAVEADLVRGADVLAVGKVLTHAQAELEAEEAVVGQVDEKEGDE